MSFFSVQAVKKTFAKVQAVKGVSFELKPGMCFGLLGPNGAGKTTTIEMMEGLLKPDEGQILFHGETLGDKFRQRSGIQLQTTSLMDFLTVRETLETFRNFYEQPANLQEIIADCHLGDILERDNRKLSGGQRQRLLLALALVNDPEIVFLDEPTTGLDPQARRYLWDIVQKIKARNKTVVLSTHYMEEAEILCDEIAFMNEGLIFAQGAPKKLLSQQGLQTVLCLGPQNSQLQELLQTRYGARLNQEKLEFFIDDLASFMPELLKWNCDLSHLEVRAPSLNDLFLKLAGRSLSDEL